MNQLNHIAVLVASARAAGELLAKLGVNTGPAQAWEGEGTLEIYAGGEELSARLLIMEAVKEGAYSRALKKRGPGLHHIAVDVPDLKKYVAGLAGSGWLLHPASLQTAAKTKTVYLARPGMPLLVEVRERKKLTAAPPLVARLALSLPPNGRELISALGIDGAARIDHGTPALYFSDGKMITLTELL